MSDEEFDPTKSESEEEEEEEETKEDSEPDVQEKKIFAPPQQVAPTPAQQSEAQLAMQKRREAPLKEGLDDFSKGVLETNRKFHESQEEEIRQLRAKHERRKAERQAEEARLTTMRAEEEARRKAEEKERQRKKEEEEMKRREERAEKMAEFEKWKNPPRPNFIITKKALESSEGDELTTTSTGAETAQKSKEQAEAEKRAILAQRISTLSTEGMNLAALQEKAKELHQQVFRLEGDKYDLETRHKKGQYDMVELAERARQMSKGGKGKSVRVDTGDVDPIQERYSGAPPKISLCSKYERRKDKRSYGERHERFSGPQYLYAVDRITPAKAVVWGDNGPEYTDDPNAPPPAQEQPPPPAPKPKPQAAPAEAPEQAAA